MDGLCDELVQLVFFELADPRPITLVSRRFYRFSQDPYVRAHYFLARHGPVQAFFHALGRGTVVTERVIDVLLASGAHLSRYLIQVAMHHYFHTQSHPFIKTQWVRSVPFPVLAYFLKIAAEMYGEIPCGKGDDDGSVFASFLKESRFPATMKSVSWEDIRDILEKYKFIPFSSKDPIATQFPLALAIEPLLLPLATANGFTMDTKYRDFVFRKMFERPALATDSRTDEIVRNVRELCRLDPAMFVSRTVAAEVCMEAKQNEQAYAALKLLDTSGQLRFELATLVEDLIKLFVKTRSLTQATTILVLRQLYSDFPSTDAGVRLVLLLTVFLSDSCATHTTPASLKAKLDPLGLTPTRRDIVSVMINPFVDRYLPILEYCKADIGLGMSSIAVRELIEEVAVRCLELGYKGRMLKKLCDGFWYVHETLEAAVVAKYQLDVEDLPETHDEGACRRYEAKLCRDFFVPRDALSAGTGSAVATEGSDESGSETEDGEEGGKQEPNRGGAEEADVDSELGPIGQDALSVMIRRDELMPTRSRRRMYYPYVGYSESNDPLQVGRWVKSEFGPRSRVTAIFMTHAVINDNASIFHQYLGYIDSAVPAVNRVPVTLKHFKLLARLGRAPNWNLFHDIEIGAGFYVSEEEYLTKQESTDSRIAETRIKSEGGRSWSNRSGGGSPRARKRPRRMAAAAAPSYVVPGSDDEDIVSMEERDDDDDDEEDSDDMGARLTIVLDRRQARKRLEEGNLQKWIKHLAGLLKEEQKKFKEKRKRAEEAAGADAKVRVPKNDFFKALATNLRNLRKIDQEKRLELYGHEGADELHSDGDDDEYHGATTRGKRRRTMRGM